MYIWQSRVLGLKRASGHLYVPFQEQSWHILTYRSTFTDSNTRHSTGGILSRTATNLVFLRLVFYGVSKRPNMFSCYYI